jgi:uncharacterized protein with von Willebrand factor type A (vWA) domain
MRSYRYRRWDGTQEPIGDDLTVESLIDELSEDILSGMDPQQAMRSLMRRGMHGNFGGINSLLERLRKAREREKAKGQLGGMLEQVREQLDRILEQERTALAERTDDPEARMREGYLDDLLPDPASQINGLKNYDFVSPEARAEFQELLEKLRQEVLGSAFRQLSSAMKDMTPEQIARMKEMLGDLNRMLDQKRNGIGPSQDEFDEFMRRYGDFFPENPRNLDELMEALAKRMAAMGRLLNSLSPEQRAELMDLAREVMDDMDLSFEVDRLASSLQDLFPDLDWDSAVPMDGDDQLGLREGLEAIERITDYDELERALRSDRAGPALQDVDVDKIRRTLGEDAVRDVRRLREIEKMLEQAGFLVRQRGRLKLTPRGVRKLGERALARVFERLTVDRPGTHDARDAGGMGEPTGATRPWTFGDPFAIDVQRTVHNAVLRQGPTRGRVRLQADDFEAVEAENRTTAATALLLDMSFSMPMRGNWEPAKRMALALHSLIASKYPEDQLYIIGFSALARVLAAEDLAQAGWEHEYGTNMEHAFNLAGRLLAKHPMATKQVLLVTDGEPTAHLVPGRDPPYVFQWPPMRITLEKTYKEAMRLAKAGVTMNIFMLEDSPALFQFIDRLAQVVAGRVFAVQGEELGEFVVRDYLKRRASA